MDLKAAGHAEFKQSTSVQIFHSRPCHFGRNFQNCRPITEVSMKPTQYSKPLHNWVTFTHYFNLYMINVHICESRLYRQLYQNSHTQMHIFIAGKSISCFFSSVCSGIQTKILDFCFLTAACWVTQS